MMMTTTYTVLLATILTQVAAIGPCNNTLIEELMNANYKNCPEDILGQMFRNGPQVTYRVVPKEAAITCLTGVMDMPDNSNSLLYNCLANGSLGHKYTTYTVIEGECGFIYKYIVDEAYVGYKIVMAYVDGTSFGYYGCTDEPSKNPDKNDLYTVCFAPSVDTPEVEASLLKCKAHMEKVTGDTDLILNPHCDNNNEYLAKVLARRV